MNYRFYFHDHAPEHYAPCSINVVTADDQRALIVTNGEGQESFKILQQDWNTIADRPPIIQAKDLEEAKLMMGMMDKTMLGLIDPLMAAARIQRLPRFLQGELRKLETSDVYYVEGFGFYRWRKDSLFFDDGEKCLRTANGAWEILEEAIVPKPLHFTFNTPTTTSNTPFVFDAPGAMPGLTLQVETEPTSIGGSFDYKITARNQITLTPRANVYNPPGCYTYPNDPALYGDLAGTTYCWDEYWSTSYPAIVHRLILF